MPATTFGARLRAYRKAAGLTQEELSVLMHYTRASSIAVIERSARLPRPELILLAARALNIAPARLLEGVEDPYDALRRAVLPIASNGPARTRGGGQRDAAIASTVRSSLDAIAQQLTSIGARSAAAAIERARRALAPARPAAADAGSRTAADRAGDVVSPAPRAARRGPRAQRRA